MSGRIVGALAAACLIAASGQAQHITRESIKDKPRVPARQVSGVPEGTGTVQYDPGAPADGFLIAQLPTDYFGNRFDTRNGSPLSFPGTLTRVSWYQATLGTLGPLAIGDLAPLGGPLSLQFTATGIVPNAFNSISVAWPVGGPFFVGMLARVYAGGPPNGPFGSVGLRSASTNAQGFHGIQRSFNGAVSNTLPGQNVMVRVSGDIIIPVELLEFEVE